MTIPQQTTYTRTYGDRVVGQPSDSGVQTRTTKLNNEAAEIPAGVAVVENADGKCDLFDAASDKIAGIVINDYSRDPNGLSGSSAAYADAKMFPLLEEGRIMVVVEQDVTVTDPVYVRHTANGSGKLQLGAFRKDADGVAQVTTVTPDAAQHSTVFGLRVEFHDNEAFQFTVLSDANMTATEVCDAFRTAMAANAQFAARVVGSGTATLILTGQVTGEDFTVQNAGVGTYTSITVGTPAVPHARLVKGAFWVCAGTAAEGKAELDFDRTQEWA